jgi:hypothetical protein
MKKYLNQALTAAGASYGFAIFAFFVAMMLIKYQVFTSILMIELKVDSSELAGQVVEISPFAEIQTVEIMAFGDLKTTRILYALALGLNYSPIIAGFVILGLILSRIKPNNPAGKTIPVSIFIFGLWIIASSSLSHFFEALGTYIYILQEEIQVTPGENTVWVVPPEFRLSQEFVFSLCVGLVLMAGSSLISRGIKAEKVMSEVI